MGVKVLWVGIAGFLLGVFVRSYLLLGTSFAIFFALLGVVSILLIRIEPSQKKTLILLAVGSIFFGWGVMRMQSDVLVGDMHLTRELNQYVQLQGTVSAEPDVRDTGERLTITITSVGSTSVATRPCVLAVVPPHSGVAYGDQVRVSGILTLPEQFDAGNGRMFAYPEYLAANGIGYQISPAFVATIGAGERNSFLAAALFIKEKYLASLDAVLPQPEAGLAGGITVGDKRSIGPDLSLVFQKVSLIHMVVLSGYNITVVMNVVVQLLKAAGRSVQFGGGIVVVVFFTCISGGATSAVRAGLMALLAMYARITNRTYDALRALAVVTFGMVLWNPFTLAFDPSFELSALATLGMIIYTPVFVDWFQWVTVRWGLREIVSSTLATQIVVLPFLLYQNGQLSLVALPANILALLPVPYAMLLSFVTSIAHLFLGNYAIPLVLPTYLILSYIIHVATFFAGLPFATIAIPPFTGWLLVLAYGILFAYAVAVHSYQSDKNKTTS